MFRVIVIEKRLDFVRPERIDSLLGTVCATFVVGGVSVSDAMYVLRADKALRQFGGECIQL